MAQAKMSGAGIAGWVVAAALAVAVIARCSPQTSTPAPSASSTALAVTRTVAAHSLNCRSEPSASAAAVRSYARDNSLAIEEEQDGWAKVAGDPPCWVASRYLAGAIVTTAGAAAGSTARTPAPSSGGTTVSRPTSDMGDAGVDGSTSARHSSTGGSSSIAALYDPPARKRSKSRKKRRSSDTYSGGGCPCSGRQVCIGPRGGRYCITSGGNKRYGV